MRRLVLNKKYHSVPSTACLIIALIVMQGVPLHVHIYNHNHGTQNHTASMTDHTHLDQIHSSYDSSATDHSNQVISKVDIEWDSLLKNVSPESVIIAILTTLIIVCLCPRLNARISLHHVKDILPIARCNTIRPPLRAPPQVA